MLHPFDLPEQFMQSNGQPQATAVALRHYYNNIIGPFEDAYRKNMAREQQQRALQQGRAQGGMPMPGGGPPRPSMGPMSGTFPPVGTLPAMNGNSGSGMMVQPTAGNALQPTDTPLGGISGMQFAGSQGLPQAPQGSQLPVGGMNGTPDMRGLGSMDMTNLDGINLPMTASGSTGPVEIVEADGRKRKVEDLEDLNMKRARQKIGNANQNFLLESDSDDCFALFTGDSSDPRNVRQTGFPFVFAQTHSFIRLCRREQMVKTLP